MKILYDYQTFYLHKFGGISNSFVQLMKNLPDNIRFELATCESDNVHLRESGIKNVPSMSCSVDNFMFNTNFRGKGKLYNLYNKINPKGTSLGRNRKCSINALKKGDFDIFHPTFFDDYFLPYLNGKPFVLTVHDMIPELFFPKFDEQVKKKPRLCQQAAHIVAVSQKTKSDLIEMMNIPEEKITVVYHGAPECRYAVGSSPIIGGRYILYVGNRLGYKSFLPMLESLAPVLHRHEDISIVCTGEEFTRKEKKRFEELGVEKRMCHLRVNDSDMQNLYGHALCFIYPSLYEGFGIPILEAYSSHCPVLLNHKSCFPEIAQDAALYFNLDNNSSDLENVLEHFLSMTDEEKDILIQKQQNRLQIFSWKISAKKLAEIYMKVVEER